MLKPGIDGVCWNKCLLFWGWNKEGEGSFHRRTVLLVLSTFVLGSESFAECAKRETMEETGLKLLSVRHETTVNVIWKEANYHYIDVVMKAVVDRDYKAEPWNPEPHKCEGLSPA